jgi:hypothetical protein
MPSFIEAHNGKFAEVPRNRTTRIARCGRRKTWT